MTTQTLKPSWKVWRFEQIATNVNVRIDNPSESGMEHYVGLEHLDPDSLRIRRWGSPSDVEAGKLFFKTGDIIFAKRRAYQRKLGVAEFDGICSAHAMVLRAKPEVVLPEFLPFFMQSDLFMNRAVEISVGSLSPTINWKTMAVQEFSLPSMGEQRRIVELISAFDEQIESLEIARSAALRLKNAMAESVFPVAEVKSYLDKPKEFYGRQLVPLGQVVSLQVGYPFKSAEYSTKGDRLLRGSNVGVNRLNWEPDITCYWPIERRSQVPDYVLVVGDVVIAMDRPFISEGFKIARVKNEDLPALLLQRVGRFKMGEEIKPEYLWSFLHAESFRWQLQRMQKGTDLPHISKFDIEGTLIPQLTVDEQIEISECFSEIEASTAALEKRLTDAKDQRRQALGTCLFRES